MVSQNHRLVEVGRDVWRSSSPSPCSKQGELEQVAQGRVRSGFEYLQGWRDFNLSGQPAPGLMSPVLT